jgi:hypothetical protein
VAVRNLPLDATFGLAPLVHSTVPDRHFRWFYELLDGEIVEHDRRLPHRRGVESAGAATKESLLRRLFHRGLPHGASGGGSGEAHPRCVPSQYP